MTQQLGWAVGQESFSAWGASGSREWGSPFSEITERQKQKRTLERLTRDIENSPLKSWYGAQLVRCHSF